MKRGIAKEEEMKLGKKTVVTIGVLLSALLCVNMILYTPASADGNTKLKTSKNDISSETVNMHQGVSMSYAQIVQTYSDEYYGTQDPTVTSKWGGGHIWRCGASYCPYNGPICYYGR